jgi:hypothetical protein
MQLITSRNNDCVAASVAMLLGLTLEEVKSHHLFSEAYLTYPFPKPWHEVPKVPAMEEVCEWAFQTGKIGLVPFPLNPRCTPSHGCPDVPVFQDKNKAFCRQLDFGPGLLEGMTSKGHMCAWDGTKVYDPRGRIYPLTDAFAHSFYYHRFWLKVN